MPLLFQTESFDDFLRDGQHIFPRHFAELSLNQDKIPFGLDEEMYRKVEAANFLHILTARINGYMVGYVLSMVYKNHPHNKDAGPYSSTDMFYIIPEHRNGSGLRLLLENEMRLKALGVKRMSISTKLMSSHYDLFNKLGYTATDVVFHKLFP